MKVKCKGYPNCGFSKCKHTEEHDWKAECYPYCFEGNHCQPTYSESLPESNVEPVNDSTK